MVHSAEGRYLPAEDSYLLRDAAKGLSGGACLEIGFGSGAVVSSLSQRFRLAVGTDVLRLDEARLARSPGVDLVLADRAGCFRDGSFDLVLFNPPYLPSEDVEDAAVDGGRFGVEVPTAFLEDGARVMKPRGTLLALVSDSGDVDAFLARGRELGLKARRVAGLRVFFENLLVFKMERSAGRPKAPQGGRAVVGRKP